MLDIGPGISHAPWKHLLAALQQQCVARLQSLVSLLESQFVGLKVGCLGPSGHLQVGINTRTSDTWGSFDPWGYIFQNRRAQIYPTFFPMPPTNHQFSLRAKPMRRFEPRHLVGLQRWLTTPEQHWGKKRHGCIKLHHNISPGWWLSHRSEKYDFVSWVFYPTKIMESHKSHVPVTTNQL